MPSAEENMRIDSEKLKNLSKTSPITIQFYEWQKPSMTYGYFIDPEKMLDLKNIEKLDWQIARRPTGGGIILHPYDLAFSVLIPAQNEHFSDNTLENYAFVNKMVANAIEGILGLRPEILKMDCTCQGKVDFCMSKPTQYDVVVKGKKVAGAAQRKTKQGLLHQGSICLVLPNQEHLKQLIKDENVINEILKNSFPLATYLKVDKGQLSEKIKKALINQIELQQKI